MNTGSVIFEDGLFAFKQGKVYFVWRKEDIISASYIVNEKAIMRSSKCHMRLSIPCPADEWQLILAGLDLQDLTGKLLSDNKTEIIRGFIKHTDENQNEHLLRMVASEFVYGMSKNGVLIAAIAETPTYNIGLADNIVIKIEANDDDMNTIKAAYRFLQNY